MRINFNKEKIINDIKNMKYSEKYKACSDHTGEWVEEYSSSEEEFNQELISLIDKVNGMDVNFLLDGQIRITKKGTLDKRISKYTLISTGLCSEYNDRHGSHQYSVLGIYAVRTADTEVTIELTTKRKQKEMK